MSPFMVVFVTGLMLISCINKNGGQERESRLDPIMRLPYRTTRLSDEQTSELLEIGKIVWKEYVKRDTSSDMTLLGGQIRNKSIYVESSEEPIDSLRELADNLWTKQDFVWTALVFHFFLVNAQTDVEELIYAMEIEHEELTGTFDFIIPASGGFERDEPKFTYRERN